MCKTLSCVISSQLHSTASWMFSMSGTCLGCLKEKTTSQALQKMLDKLWIGHFTVFCTSSSVYSDEKCAWRVLEPYWAIVHNYTSLQCIWWALWCCRIVLWVYLQPTSLDAESLHHVCCVFEATMVSVCCLFEAAIVRVWCFWSYHGQSVLHFWSYHGQSVLCFWSYHSQSVLCFWSNHDQKVLWFWSYHGQSVLFLNYQGQSVLCFSGCPGHGVFRWHTTLVEFPTEKARDCPFTQISERKVCSVDQVYSKKFRMWSYDQNCDKKCVVSKHCFLCTLPGLDVLTKTGNMLSHWSDCCRVGGELLGVQIVWNSPTNFVKFCHSDY